MRTAQLLSLLALVVSAAALVIGIRVPRPSEPRAALATLPRGGGVESEILARLQGLEEENGKLRERLSMVEMHRDSPLPQRLPVLDGFASREELEALRTEILSMFGIQDDPSAALPAFADSPAFQDHVADTLERIRREETDEKMRTYQEQRSQRLDEDVEKLREWLELSSPQADAMRAALLAQYAREAEQLHLWEAGVEDHLLEERKQSDGETFHAELAGILTPEQFQTFWSKAARGAK